MPGALLALEHYEGRRPDAIVQVGDSSAFPSPDHLEPVVEYLMMNPAQGDVFRLPNPSPGLERSLEAFKLRLPRPVLVVGGHHEDHDWLRARHRGAGGLETVPLDEISRDDIDLDAALDRYRI